MKHWILAAATTLAGCVDSDPSFDSDGDGDPDNDCLFGLCGGGGGGGGPLPPPPSSIVVERDVSAVRPPGGLAVGGRWRLTVTSANPAGGQPTVELTANSIGNAEVAMVTSDETSVTVDVTGLREGALDLRFQNTLGVSYKYERVAEAEDFRLVVPDTYSATSATRIYRGEPRVLVDLCSAECASSNGEKRLVDASLEETAGSALVQTAWDTFTLPEEPGSYPVRFELQSFPTTSIDLEIVDAVDRIEAKRFDGSPPQGLPASGWLCFHGVRGADHVMSSVWTASADGLVVTPSHLANCIEYEGLADRTYTLEVTGVGLTQQLEITTAPPG